MSDRRAYLLRDYLTEADVEDLRGMRHDMNFHLRWGRIVNECFPAMLQTMESVLFESSPLVKKKPIDSLFPHVRAKLEDPEKGELMRQFLVLEFTRKLLGALKTRVNQEIRNLPYLTEEQEERLLEEGDLRAELEEMDLLANPVFQPLGPDEVLSEDEETVEETDDMEADLPPRSDEVNIFSYLTRHRKQSESSSACEHVRTTVSYPKTSKGTTRREYCKDCRQVVSEVWTGSKVTDKSAVCKHSHAEWVPGKEGKEARCANPECQAPIENPARFTWEKAGLEPFGDDPSKDEVLVLDEVM